VPIFSRTWQLPASRTSAVVLLVHGLNGHSGYDSNLWTAHSLVNRGFTVVAIDVEGHGRSGGQRALVSDFETDVAGDIVALLLRTRERYPGKPLFLMGNSMGGLSAALTALAVQTNTAAPLLGDDGRALAPAAALLSGVVLQCPLIRPAKVPPRAMQAAARVLAWLAPHLPLLPHAAGAGSTVAAAVRQRMLADKLCYCGWMRLGTGLALQRGAAHLAARLEEVSLPLLLQHGSEDPLVAHRGSAELVARAASCDKTLITYSDAGHNLLNEVPATLQRVRADYLDWLDARVDASALSAGL
jgi:alpha-beta hydrolase superfamily lysophospholipase